MLRQSKDEVSHHLSRAWRFDPQCNMCKSLFPIRAHLGASYNMKYLNAVLFLEISV